MATTKGQGKLANAVRVSGDLYDVWYPGAKDFDRRVHYSYLRRLARDGFRVTVEQKTCRGEGEPETFVVEP